MQPIVFMLLLQHSQNFSMQAFGLLKKHSVKRCHNVKCDRPLCRNQCKKWHLYQISIWRFHLHGKFLQKQNLQKIFWTSWIEYTPMKSHNRIMLALIKLVLYYTMQLQVVDGTLGRRPHASLWIHIIISTIIQQIVFVANTAILYLWMDLHLTLLQWNMIKLVNHISNMHLTLRYILYWIQFNITHVMFRHLSN